MSHTHEIDPEEPDVEERSQPLIVQDRGIAERISGSKPPRSQTLPEQRPTHAFDQPRLEVGPPTDERRITRERPLSRDQTWPGLRKETNSSASRASRGQRP